MSKKQPKSMSAIQEPFSEGASLVHRLDPRGKIVVAALFAVLMAVAKSISRGPGRTGRWLSSAWPWRVCL